MKTATHKINFCARLMPRDRRVSKAVAERGHKLIRLSASLSSPFSFLPIPRTTILFLTPFLFETIESASLNEIPYPSVIHIKNNNMYVPINAKLWCRSSKCSRKIASLSCEHFKLFNIIALTNISRNIIDNNGKMIDVRKCY